MNAPLRRKPLTIWPSHWDCRTRYRAGFEPEAVGFEPSAGTLPLISSQTPDCKPQLARRPQRSRGIGSSRGRDFCLAGLVAQSFALAHFTNRIQCCRGLLRGIPGGACLPSRRPGICRELRHSRDRWTHGESCRSTNPINARAFLLLYGQPRRISWYRHGSLRAGGGGVDTGAKVIIH